MKLADIFFATYTTFNNKELSLKEVFYLLIKLDFGIIPIKKGEFFNAIKDDFTFEIPLRTSLPLYLIVVDLFSAYEKHLELKKVK